MCALPPWCWSSQIRLFLKDNLFISPGDEETVEILREVSIASRSKVIGWNLTIGQCLDTGSDFPYPFDTSDSKIPLAFATTLLRLLDSLVEPVIPASVHPRCIEMTNRDEAFDVRLVAVSSTLDLTLYSPLQLLGNGSIPPASVNVSFPVFVVQFVVS